MRSKKKSRTMCGDKEKKVCGNKATSMEDSICCDFILFFSKN